MLLDKATVLAHMLRVLHASSFCFSVFYSFFKNLWWSVLTGDIITPLGPVINSVCICSDGCVSVLVCVSYVWRVLSLHISTNPCDHWQMACRRPPPTGATPLTGFNQRSIYCASVVWLRLQHVLLVKQNMKGGFQALLHNTQFWRRLFWGKHPCWIFVYLRKISL